MPRPFLIITAILGSSLVSLAAANLYLPAVPSMPAALGTSVEAIQITVAAFSLGLAGGQLIAGALADRYGHRKLLLGGLTLFSAASAGCSLAPEAMSLIGFRLLQGIGASATGAVAAPVIRSLFSEGRSVQVMNLFGSIESLVPALAPAAGAALLLLAGWRDLFWIVTGLGVLSLTLALAVMPRDGIRHGGPGLLTVLLGYRDLLRHRRYMGLALSQGLGFAALLTFVGSAPYAIAAHLGGGAAEFVYLQFVLVGGFIIVTNIAGAIAQRGTSAERLIVIGTLIQGAGALSFAAYVALAPDPGWLGLALSFALVCYGLGVRGGATFTRSITLMPAHAGRAASFLIFAMMGLAGAGTAAVAPFLELGLWPLVVATVLLVGLAGGMLALSARPKAPSRRPARR